MVNNQHILFIHIPKTAGTSLRLSIEKYFGKKNTFYDYSSHSKETSKEIIDCAYNSKDLYKLYQKISKLKCSFLSGHFNVNKYTPLYDTLNVVSFVRNPLEQILSHYNHYQNLHYYDKDFVSFIKEPRFRNLQSKALNGKPIALYGFLGLTEEYKVSIDIFNAYYGTDLKYIHTNAKQKNSLNIEDIDEDTLKLIVRLNKNDIKLYEAVKRQFEVRKGLYEKDLPFTYGFIQKVTGEQISGLAFQKESNEAVEIDIYRSDTYIETVRAKNLRPGQKNVPRKGFIGFDYIYKGDEALDGKLHAFVKVTGQEIV